MNKRVNNDRDNFVSAGGWNGIREAEIEAIMNRMEDLSADPMISPRKRDRLLRKNAAAIEQQKKLMAA